MRSQSVRILSVLLSLVALVVAGCGSGSAPTAGDPAKSPEGTKAPTTSQAPLEKVKVPMSLGDPTLFIYLQPLLAEKLGYFEAEGITVEAKTYKGGSAIAQALASREVKFASMGLDNVIRYGAKDMVALAVYTQTPGMVFMVNPKYKDSIKSFQDLKGKKVGITSSGAGSHTVFMAMLQAKDMKTTDVEYVPVGFALDKAFADDKIVAGYAYDPLATRMLAKKEGILLADLRGIEETKKYLGGEFTTSVLATSRDVFEKEPELVQKVVRAIMKAHNFILTKPAEEISKAVPAEVRGDEKAYVDGLKNSKIMFHPNGLLTTQLVENSVRLMKATKALPETEQIAAEKLIDTKFASGK